MIYLMKVRGWQIQDWKRVDLILKPMLLSIIRPALSRAPGEQPGSEGIREMWKGEEGKRGMCGLRVASS